MQRSLLVFILFFTIVPLASSTSGGEGLYDYIKAEEYNPQDFTLALLPGSVVPIEKIIKYEKRLNVDLRVGEGDASKTMPRGSLASVEYRARVQGRPYEPLIYLIDYLEGPVNKKVSLVSPSWIKAYNFIMNQTEQDALILCWWHHGKRVELFTGREVIVSAPSRELIEGLPVPSETYKTATLQNLLKWLRQREGLEEDARLKDVARFFCSREDKALDILKKYNPLGRPLYILVSAEEFPEADNMNRLAGEGLKLRSRNVGRFTTTTAKDMAFINQWLKSNNISSYYAQIYDDYYTLWYLEDQDDPEMKEALLPRLLPLKTGQGQGLRYFTPVFNSDEAHVWIYRFVPEGISQPEGTVQRGFTHGHH